MVAGSDVLTAGKLAGALVSFAGVAIVIGADRLDLGASLVGDLVTLGRGPRVGAYLKEAEIARLPGDRREGQLATTMRVPLDSTYLFERDSAGRYVGPAGPP